MNPYGVDLEMFPSAQRHDSDKEFTLLFVGSWSLQKGCDLLVSAVARESGSAARSCRIDWRQIWLFRQDDARFVHIDPVPQTELARFYAEADAFVLASRQDGFGVVLAQALASGLPVICTDRTGGADLAHTPALAQRITIIPHDDVPALVAAMARLRDRHKSGERLPPCLRIRIARRSRGRPTGVVMPNKSRLILVNAAGRCNNGYKTVSCLR